MATREQRGPLWGAGVETDLEALASELSLPEFDLLLVGDGSGTVYDKPCGWACVAWNKLTSEVRIHNGGTDCGTNNFAELIPYVHALWYFDQVVKPNTQAGRKMRVQIVSDSEVTVRCGNKIYARKGNGPLWASIEWFEQSGYYDITWNHVHRNTNRFSKRCDWLAGETRMSLKRLRENLLENA